MLEADICSGLYQQQDKDQHVHNLRGKFVTDESGEYACYCIRPTPYPIPFDGPAGKLLQLMDRHPYRPAHIHLIVSPAFRSFCRDYVQLTETSRSSKRAMNQSPPKSSMRSATTWRTIPFLPSRTPWSSSSCRGAGTLRRRKSCAITSRWLQLIHRGRRNCNVRAGVL